MVRSSKDRVEFGFGEGVDSPYQQEEIHPVGMGGSSVQQKGLWSCQLNILSHLLGRWFEGYRVVPV